MSEPPFKYWAFLSYAHADERWTAWLHRALEGYRIPARLVGRSTPRGPIPRKLFPVFRDRDELAGSASLGPELQKALKGSSALVVVCSPPAARSRWVNEEIKFYKSLGRADRVFALIVDGEPNSGGAQECFPEALRFDVGADGNIIRDSPVEPIAADGRRQGDGKLNAKLKLISGLLGVGFDELRQREMQSRNRRMAIVAGLASVVAATTLVLAIQASIARDDAKRRQQQAEDLIEFMLGDLRKNLEPIGKLDILGAVGDKAMDYFASLDEQDVTDTVLRSRATALRQIGHVRAKQGNIESASEAFQEALKLDSELVKRHPGHADSLSNVAESQSSVGYGHYVRGEVAQARPWFEKELATLRRLAELDPADGQVQARLATAWGSLGGLSIAEGNTDGARKNFGKALAIQQALAEAEPDNREYLTALADLHGWLNYLETANGRHDAALEQARLQNTLLRRLTELEPEHADYRHQLASGLMRALYSRSSLERVPPGDPELQEALRLCAELVELDPSNVTYARSQAVALSYLEDAALVAGDVETAGEVNAQSRRLARRLYERAPDSAELLDDLLSVYVRSAKLALLLQDEEQARTLIEEALALPSTAQDASTRRLELVLMKLWTAADDVERQRAGEQVKRAWAALEESGAPVRADIALRYHALAGDLAAAAEAARRLTRVERAHPYLRQFCDAFNVPLAAESAAAGG